MKRVKKLALAIVVTNSLLCAAQPSLTYETHALLPGEDNPMSICNYANPGMSGANMTWNFSDLQFEKSFTGYLATYTDQTIHSCNTVLTEFNSLFYFDVTPQGITQYGYASDDGKLVTEYDVPFEKIKYPFSYGDQYSGSFSATTSYQGTPQSELNGTYSVEADGYGKLILPGNISYDNTLRVATTRNYTSTSGSTTSDIELTTYRWYNNSHRYPLLVLTEYKVTTAGNTNITYQSAYNNNAVQNLSPVQAGSLSVFPNPASSSLNLSYTAIAAGTLHCSIIDPSGRVVRQFDLEVNTSGRQAIDLSQHITGLRAANYQLRMESGKEVFEQSFVKVDN